MGRLTIAARFSDLETICFKVGKSNQFTEIQNVLFLLDENKFKEFLLEKDYNTDSQSVDYATHTEWDSKKAFFAPFDYGIVFIDFFHKRVFSYNNYSGFLETPVLGAINEFRPLLNNTEFLTQKDMFYNYTYNVTNYKGEIEKSYRLFEDFFYFMPLCYNIHQTLINNGQILIKNYTDSSDNKIYKDIDTITFFNLFKKDYFEKLNTKCSNSSEDITINNIPFSLHSLACLPSGWDFIQDTGEKKSIKKLFFTLKKDIEFTCEEQECWQEYFKED